MKLIFEIGTTKPNQTNPKTLQIYRLMVGQETTFKHYTESKNIPYWKIEESLSKNK